MVQFFPKSLLKTLVVSADDGGMKHTQTTTLLKPDTGSFERIGPAKCLCFRGWDAMWHAKKNAVICSHCDEERFLPAELTGIIIARCDCGAGKDATWFATKDGNRVCSNCGERR